MPSNRRPRLSLTKAKGVHVFKCVFPKCNNFFTSTSDKSVKYCQNHAHYPTSRNPRNLLLLASLSLVVLLALPNAEAATNLKGKGVGIIIERSCLISSSCLNYSDIVQFDNSLTEYSGGFVRSGDDVIRKTAPYQNSYGIYEFDATFRIFVDPPPMVKTKLPLIHIVSSLDHYFLPGQKVVIDNTRTWSHTRYVDATCTNAIITAKNWEKVLTDTIAYLNTNCDPKATKLDTLGIEIRQATDHNIAETQKYKLESLNKYVKENCLESYGKCEPPNPYNVERNQALSKQAAKPANHYVLELRE